MTNTNSIVASGTQVTPTKDVIEVKTVPGPLLIGTSEGGGEKAEGVLVYVSSQQKSVLLRLEPSVLTEQRRIEELNDRIQKYGKAY